MRAPIAAASTANGEATMRAQSAIESPFAAKRAAALSRKVRVDACPSSRQRL